MKFKITGIKVRNYQRDYKHLFGNEIFVDTLGVHYFNLGEMIYFSQDSDCHLLGKVKEFTKNELKEMLSVRNYIFKNKIEFSNMVKIAT